MNIPTVVSNSSDPCHEQLDHFTKCVNSHPKGLKETDCEVEKQIFRQCMKERKQRIKS